MSTKTLRKRIALVAVASLGFGLMSVVPTNAATGGTTAPTDENLYVKVDQSATGDAAIADVYTDGSNYSNGLLAYDAVTATGGAVVSGAILKDGKVVIVAASATDMGVKVTNGTITAKSGATASISADGTSLYQSTDSQDTAFAVKATGALGSVMSIQVFGGASITATAPTAGSLIGIVNLTIATPGISGVSNVANSIVTQQAAIAKSGTAAGTNAYDTSDRIENGKVGVIYTYVKDALKVPVSSGTLAASATGGALVKWGAAGSEGYSATTSFDTVAVGGTAKYLNVVQPVANTAGSTTVTISIDGVVLATKTLNWSGDLTKLTPSYSIAGSLGASDGKIKFNGYDAAGNRVLTGVSGSTGGTPSYSATGSVIVPSLSGFTNSTATASGYAMYACSSTVSGTASVTLKVTNAAGNTVYAPALTVACGEDAIDTFSISLDKASYNTGDVAKLTITALDSNGKPVSDAAELGAGAAISVGGMTAVTAPVSADVPNGAVAGSSTWTYTYTVGTTTGSYVASVQLPSSGTDVTAKTIQFKIVDGSGAVSNADVLKAIVSLIASINKQIAALQKALLKK